MVERPGDAAASATRRRRPAGDGADQRPGRLARAAARLGRARRELRRRPLGDRRPGRADPDRRPRTAPSSTASRGLVARPRGALAPASAASSPRTPGPAPAANISAHYDLGNDLFAAFLDERMMYSCAYLPSSGASLEDAQLAKLDRICERLRLGPENHLLEIGTGWGGMAIHAARRSGCRVTTTTISRRAVRAGDRSGSARPASRTRSRSCSRTTATSTAATTGWSRSR